MQSAQSRGRVTNTRMALATAQKASSTIADFFGKVKGLADDMAAAGKKLGDEEVASYILAGLDGTYDPVVSTISGRTTAEPLTLGELYTQLTSWEQQMDLLGGGSDSLANSATRGGHSVFKRGGEGLAGARGHGHGKNGGNRHQNNGDG